MAWVLRKNFYPRPHKVLQGDSISIPKGLAKLSLLAELRFMLFSSDSFVLLLFLAALGLSCGTQLFSSCSELGLLSSSGARASHWGGFSYSGAQAPELAGFSSCCPRC